MTPKEKAKELYLKYTDALNIRDLVTTANPFAKQCALIAVDEILKLSTFFNLIAETEYWNEVKKEIEAL
jgi:hypothetical protein